LTLELEEHLDHRWLGYLNALLEFLGRDCGTSELIPFDAVERQGIGQTAVKGMVGRRW
jgi:hypothetical protein